MPVRAFIRNGRVNYQVLDFGESKYGTAQVVMPHAPEKRYLRLSVVLLY
jgi:hypothetical protein